MHILQVRVHTGSDPLDVVEAIGFVAEASAGGTVLFSGTVRSPNDGEVVDHLTYEMWDEKVDGELESIARRAIDRFGASRVYVAHRSGRVEVGEPSVLVAVSAPHRGEAFEAARFVIDTLKAEASIWKQEVTASSAKWVGMPQDDRQSTAERGSR